MMDSRLSVPKAREVKEVEVNDFKLVKNRYRLFKNSSPEMQQQH